MVYRICWIFCIFAFGPLFRHRVSGRKNIPKEGPLLLLANHTAMLDPVNVGWFCMRPVHFMASEQLFQFNRPLNWLLKNLNTFPKAKGVKDRTSMLQMVRRYKAGNIVNLYPEGERTWTGRLLPIVPSTPRMLKRLGARVVYCRIVNGHLSHPRWADYPRWIRLKLEYSPVFVYDDPDRPNAEIMAEMESKLRVVPEEVDVEGFAFGWRMAWGLPDFLWACPTCFAQDALSVAPDNGNAVVCSQCAARWRIDVSQRLFGETRDATDTRVVTAYDAILDHYSFPPITDQGRHEADGVVLEAVNASILLIHRGVKETDVLGRGTARLTPDRIGIYGPDGAVLWERPLTDFKAILASIGNQLHLRTGEEKFQLVPGNESRNKWQYFIKAWWSLAQERP
ncbi:MAG: 1-acyl-sn-glycerol-3-phosphate acyltransferase [Myxococcota bacterium]